MEKIMKTTYPDKRLPFNEWCETFKVSSMYVDREGMNKANKIMELWDGFSRMKEKFVKKN